ncbi:MAG: hypothetical protein A4E32_00093 [Methanomassiliicoccales archaeon PtaU1.Bin124]|nr:MAG: hypothetical protein A4E32_00093 [Methanomassiliicoccales archaeon PtaU1.Bin124]
MGTIRERLFLERLRCIGPERVDPVAGMKQKARAKYIEENWQKLFPPVDAALLKVVTAPLQRVVSKGMDPATDEMMRTHWEPQIKAKLHNTYEFYVIMLRYSSSVKERNAEEQSRLLLNYYLLLVEGVYSAQVNLVCHLLCNMGQQYRSSKSAMEHGPAPGSIGVIEEDSLWNKLRFLEDNGFSFMVDACDRQLRNSVAHLDFIVFTNGCVGYGTTSRGPKVISYDELVHKVEVLKSITDAVNEVLADSTAAWRKAVKEKKSKTAPKAAAKVAKAGPKDPKEVLKAMGMEKSSPEEREPTVRL